MATLVPGSGLPAVALLLAAAFTATAAAGSFSNCDTVLNATDTRGVRRSWCIHEHTKASSLCRAAAVCRSAGQRLVGRQLHHAMQDTGGAFARNGHWWVALTDGLEERHKAKDGWLWFDDGGERTGAGDAVFRSSEPSDSGGQDCVSTVRNGLQLRDAQCDSNYTYFCAHEPLAESPSPSQSPAAAGGVAVRFAAAEIREYRQPDAGCWQLLNNLTLPDCVVACAAAAASFGCVGVTWNSATGGCVQLMHFDAAVPLDKLAAGGLLAAWQKYALLLPPTRQ